MHYQSETNPQVSLRAHIIHSLVRQFNIPLRDQVHIMVADFLPRSCSWILLRVRRRGRRRPASPPTRTPSPHHRSRIHAHRGLCRKSSRSGHWDALDWKLVARSKPADPIAQSPRRDAILAPWWWYRRVGPAAVRECIWVPVGTIGVRRRVRGAIRSMVRCRTAVVCSNGGRISWTL